MTIKVLDVHFEALQRLHQTEGNSSGEAAAEGVGAPEAWLGDANLTADRAPGRTGPSDLPMDAEGRGLLVEELTEAVLRKSGLEGRLRGVAKGFQRNGKQLLSDLQRWQQDMHAAASQDIQRQEEALRGLQAENTRLKDAVRGLADWLLAMGLAVPQAENAPAGGAAPAPAGVGAGGRGQGAAGPAAPPGLARKRAAGAAAPAQPRGTRPDGGHPVVVTLRRADGVALGLRVASEWEGKGLRVEGIEPGGAAEAWNRLCDPPRVIRAGDVLVAVNGATLDALGMLQECQRSSLLKLVIARGQDGPLPTVSSRARQQHTARALDADAPEFTPMAPPRKVLGERQCNTHPGFGDMRVKQPLPRLEENALAEKENEVFEDCLEHGAEHLVHRGESPCKCSPGGVHGAADPGLDAASEENKEN